MKYKIAFLGPQEFWQDEYKDLFTEIEKICDLDYIVYKTKNFDDIMDIYNKKNAYYDGIMFSGLIHYQMVKQLEENKNKPFKHLNFTQRDFYRELFKTYLNEKDFNFSRCFIDFLRKDNNYYDLYSILSENNTPYTLKNYPEIENETDLKKVYDFAYEKQLDLWENKKIDISFTRDYFIHEELLNLGYKSKYLVPSKQSILESFNELIKAIDLYKLDENRVSTCIITFNKSEFEDDDFIFKIESILSKMDEIINECFNKNGIYNISIFKQNLKIEIQTTKENLIKITQNYTRSILLTDLVSELNYNFNIGWGIGNTNVHATKNAIKANKLSAKNGGNCMFVIDNLENIFGPILPVENQDEINQNPIVDKISDKIPLSKMNITKVISIIEERNSNKISAEILSEYMGITIRSANRILSTLCKYNIATMEEEKKESNKRGRPKKTYIIDFGRVL